MTPIRVLVVDDEAGVRAAWMRALGHAGFTAWGAESAKQALELCDEHNFDVAVLDFIMPEMDGAELLARIRRTHPYVRSIIVSGKIDKSLTREAVESTLREAVEADLYLNKPVSNDELTTSINRLMERAEAADWTEIATKIDATAKQRMKDVRKRASSLKPRRGQRKK